MLPRAREHVVLDSGLGFAHDLVHTLLPRLLRPALAHALLGVAPVPLLGGLESSLLLALEQLLVLAVLGLHGDDLGPPLRDALLLT